MSEEIRHIERAASVYTCANPKCSTRMKESGKLCAKCKNPVQPK